MDLKSNEPFWLVKNGLLQTYPSLHQDKSCDVLIIGSGITGSLIAHQSIKDGYKTILIDKREIANGSSSATTSMLQYEIDTPLYKLINLIGKKGAIDAYKSCSESIDKLEVLCREIKSKAGFKRKDSLYYAALKKDLDWLKNEYDARKEAGFDVKWLDSETIQNKYDLHSTYGGILSTQGASVDAFQLVHEILAYNVVKGLEVYDKTELVHTQNDKGGCLCSLKSGSQIRAKKIIYCVGYESANMIKENFVNLISTYAIVSEVEVELSKKYKDLLIWNTAEPYIYMRTTDDNRILIGGEDEEFRNPVKRDSLISKKEKKLMNSYLKLKPDSHFYADFAWAGTFGETKDGLPYIGAHKDFKNSFFVLGFGGNGITFSVTGMEMVSTWLKGKKHHLDEIFKFGR